MYPGFRLYNHRALLWFSGAWGQSHQQAKRKSFTLALLAAIIRIEVKPVITKIILSREKALQYAFFLLDCIISLV